jgi:hypothetical protein
MATRSDRGSIARASFNRDHATLSTSRKGSFTRASFDKTNAAMLFPDITHLEVSDDVGEDESIESVATGPFVWLVAFSASIAGSLFGYGKKS